MGVTLSVPNGLGVLEYPLLSTAEIFFQRLWLMWCEFWYDLVYLMLVQFCQILCIQICFISRILYTGYISRWFNFREFREPLIAKIFTLIHVYLH